MSQKTKLLFIFVISVAPIVLSYVLYYAVPHEFFQAKTVGDLLPIQPIAPLSARTLDGQPFSNQNFQHKWILLTVDDAACVKACQEKLFRMRQWRLAQGEEMDRLERVFLTRDTAPITPAALELMSGGLVAQGLAPNFEAQLPIKADQRASDYIYLIDPLGNQVFRYGLEHDRSKVLSEIRKVMKNNKRIG